MADNIKFCVVPVRFHAPLARYCIKRILSAVRLLYKPERPAGYDKFRRSESAAGYHVSVSVVVFTCWCDTFRLLDDSSGMLSELFPDFQRGGKTENVCCLTICGDYLTNDFSKFGKSPGLIMAI
jgi:hypothetical protein